MYHTLSRSVAIHWVVRAGKVKVGFKVLSDTSGSDERNCWLGFSPGPREQKMSLHDLSATSTSLCLLAVQVFSEIITRVHECDASYSNFFSVKEERFGLLQPRARANKTWKNALAHMRCVARLPWKPPARCSPQVPSFSSSFVFP